MHEVKEEMIGRQNLGLDHLNFNQPIGPKQAKFIEADRTYAWKCILPLYYLKLYIIFIIIIDDDDDDINTNKKPYIWGESSS